MSISTRAWSFPVPGRCCKALSRAGRGLLFPEKGSKRILAKLVVTCRHRGVFCKGVVSTARRGGVPFTRVRRRGLCSMSGRYPYGIGNPPTLRRSSFPQRAFASRRGPHTKHYAGAVPQAPLTLKLRLDTNDAKHRPYSAADTFSRRLRRILFGFCRPIAESYAAKTMGRTSNYLDRRPLPRHGGGERGCEAERRQWRMQRGGGGKYAVATFGAHLCAVRICFSRLLREKQYSYPAQLSVKGVCKGESLVPLCPVLLPFAGAKGRPPRRAVLTMPLQKAPRRRRRLQIGPPPQATTGHNKNCPKSTPKRKEGPL